MPFDPTRPVNGVIVDADFLRAQFNALNDRIDASPGITSVVLDGVATLDPGQPATVSAGVVGSELHLAFGIPRGGDGSNGADGPPGPIGPDGEVTNAQLADAVAGTSNNTNAVATLNTPFADPDTEALRQKFNELILAARR